MEQLPNNLDFLLDKNWVEKFLNQESETIFKQHLNIELISLERSKSFAPEAYNMFYKLKINNEILLLRASASTILSKEIAFQVMKYLYNNGLNKGIIKVPEPYYYYKKYNLIFYKDAPGLMLRDVIAEDKEIFAQKLHYIGLGLKQMHAFPSPKFQLPELLWKFDFNKIARYVPKVDLLFGSRLENNLKIIQQGNKQFCHGDFQPKNIIAGDSLFLIDFNSSTMAAKELDVASFVNQLHIMLKRYGNVNNFEFYQNSFLNSYGQYDTKYYNAYSYLIQLDIFEALISLLEDDPNADKEQLKSAIDYWIKKI